MLEFRNVAARYGGFTVLRDISFSVPPGERVAIFGHNGAGKTTLLRCGVGDVAEVDGHDCSTTASRSCPVRSIATRGAASASCRRATTCFAT